MLETKLLTIYKTITREQLINYSTTGIIVGIFTLLLAIALGVYPHQISN